MEDAGSQRFIYPRRENRERTHINSTGHHVQPRYGRRLCHVSNSVEATSIPDSDSQQRQAERVTAAFCSPAQGSGYTVDGDKSTNLRSKVWSHHRTWSKSQKFPAKKRVLSRWLGKQLTQKYQSTSRCYSRLRWPPVIAQEERQE